MYVKRSGSIPILISSKIEVAIILKIWRKSFPQSLTRFSIRIIAESGLLYTLTSITAFCTLLSSPDTAFLIASAIVCCQSLSVG